MAGQPTNNRNLVIDRELLQMTASKMDLPLYFCSRTNLSIDEGEAKDKGWSSAVIITHNSKRKYTLLILSSTQRVADLI